MVTLSSSSATSAVEEPVFISLRDTPWHYKGEGNSNLVISLSKERIIIRLHKTELGDPNALTKYVDYEKAKREVQFWRRILIPIMGKGYFQAPILGRISDSEIEEVNGLLLTCRPANRMNKFLQCGLISIYPDYSFVDTNFPIFLSTGTLNGSFSDVVENSTFCVEIKPKQGWTFPTDRQAKCPFCLNQFLKVDKRIVPTISEYCPLDLFSGNRIRMKRALKNLLKTPQNNLKIFQDGHVVFSDISNSTYVDILQQWLEPDNKSNCSPDRLISKWCDLILDCLTDELALEESVYGNHKDFPKNNGTKYCRQSSVFGLLQPCDWSSEPLPTKCILNRILILQKLQNMDFRSIFNIYNTIDSSVDNYYYIEDLEENNCFNEIEKYLIAATAKDCSILLSFRRINRIDIIDFAGQSTVQDCDGIHYAFNMGVLDLDPKPISCIYKHYVRDKNILSSVAKFVSNLKSLQKLIK